MYGSQFTAADAGETAATADATRETANAPKTMRRLFVIFILCNWVIEASQEACLRGPIVELLSPSCKELARRCERERPNDWVTLPSLLFAGFCRILDELEARPIALNDLGVPEARVLDRPLLALKVNVDDAKTLLIAERPFEVIEERPLVVTLYR